MVLKRTRRVLGRQRICNIRLSWDLLYSDPVLLNCPLDPQILDTKVFETTCAFPKQDSPACGGIHFVTKCPPIGPETLPKEINNAQQLAQAVHAAVQLGLTTT